MPTLLLRASIVRVLESKLRALATSARATVLAALERSRLSLMTKVPAESKVKFPAVVVIEDACWNWRLPALVRVKRGVPEAEAVRISWLSV